MIRIHYRFASLAIPLTLVGLTACKDIVYRNSNPFTPPPEGAANFLGYSSVADKRTTCGNCHSGKQSTWQQTAHARAWDGLQASGHAGGECEACHTVSSLGNVATKDSVGYIATRDERYHDVQCESCHGPGLDHVLNPDLAANRPLASIAVDTSKSYGCGECHTGPMAPFVSEWLESGHANLITSRNTNPDCVGCHDAKGILTKWGVRSNFIEAASSTAYMTVTCSVCHDPHSARNERQTRFPINVASLSENLCMQCHQRRANPDPTSTRGPHSPQGPLLLGTAGWFPPNFAYAPGTLIASHGSSRNPDLCVTCHMRSDEIKDANGQTVFRATGHTFDPIPCVDAEGKTTGATDCALEERSFKTCTTCHLDEASARAAFAVAEERAKRLAGEITALLPRIPATEFSTTDNKITTGEGARFNRDMALMEGSPVHNPFLLEALLLASIKQIQTDYGLQASATISLQPELKAPPLK